MANISFVHARDHADVLFVGTLDWEAAHELVTTLETVFDHYFYRQVELLVASPGGDTRALAYYLNAVRNWSNKGIRFRTRVISTAASAGAFMVSLGDERVAEPGARLIYHHARACNANDLTASAITELHSVLRRLDDGMIGILAARALEGSADTPKVPHKAERSDREVLERLHAGLKPGKGKTRSKRRHLARAIGRAVERACRDRDHDAIKAIYRRLFETEAPISARLALTLRLIDRIGSRTAEEFRIQGTPGLTIPQWRAFYPPEGEVPREFLTRHTLVLGETGAGKTASCMLPVVAALARTPAERLGGALVIDPKLELGPEPCPGHSIDAVVRRGGGLLILTALAFVAGWLLPDPANFPVHLRDSREPCFRITWVARVTTGESEEPGPILLVHTEWTGNGQSSAPAHEESCTSSEVRLLLPPLSESVYRRRGGVFVPFREPGDRPTPRLRIPSELCLPAAEGACPMRILETT